MGKLLDAAEWAGKIYSGGWVDGGGHVFASVEPATGWQLTDVGAAAPDDVQRAVERASDAQRAWAATPWNPFPRERTPHRIVRPASADGPLRVLNARHSAIRTADGASALLTTTGFGVHSPNYVSYS